jgi:hypothetical protein
MPPARLLRFCGAFTAHTLIIPPSDENLPQLNKKPEKDRPPDRTTFQTIEHLTNWLINKMGKNLATISP